MESHVGVQPLGRDAQAADPSEWPDMGQRGDLGGQRRPRHLQVSSRVVTDHTLEVDVAEGVAHAHGEHPLAKAA